MAHDQGAARLTQGGIEFGNAGHDEVNAAICLQAIGNQRVEDVAVIDEDAMDLFALFERVIQRSVVADAQIATEPDEGGIESRHEGEGNVGNSNNARW